MLRLIANKIYFKRTFHEGNLEGISIRDSIKMYGRTQEEADKATEKWIRKATKASSKSTVKIAEVFKDVALNNV